MTAAEWRRWLRRIWVAAGLTFTAWLLWNAQAHGVDPALRRSGDSVVVRDSGDVLRLLPHDSTRKAGLLFLPGAAVDPMAYLPLLHRLAAAGHPVALVRLPWRMAASASSQAEVWRRLAAARALDSTRPWVLAGHSRGAALAARYVAEQGGGVAGLVLIATTHPKSVSLATTAVPVTKIWGTRDCVAPAEAMFANAALLPVATRWVRIEGANHAQFAHYGRQLGDCAATIPRDVQQAETAGALLEALEAAMPGRAPRRTLPTAGPP